MSNSILAEIADIIKDLLTPKKNVGDDTSYMSGKRGADLMSGKSTPGSWYEAFLLEKYVKDTTPVGDPRRVQFSAKNNIARIINWTPLLLVIVVIVGAYFFGIPAYYRWKHHYDVLEQLPRVDHAPIGRISTPKYINISRDEFDEPIAGVISILPKGYDPKSYPRDKYRVFEGEELIGRRKAHPKPNRLILEIVPGGCNIKDPDDPNVVEKHLWMYENQKFYIYVDSTKSWIQAYKVPELDRIGFNPEYAIVAKNSNIIVRFE